MGDIVFLLRLNKKLGLIMSIPFKELANHFFTPEIFLSTFSPVGTAFW